MGALFIPDVDGAKTVAGQLKEMSKHRQVFASWNKMSLLCFPTGPSCAL
jgi:hypothetical protein